MSALAGMLCVAGAGWLAQCCAMGQAGVAERGDQDVTMQSIASFLPANTSFANVLPASVSPHPSVAAPLNPLATRLAIDRQPDRFHTARPSEPVIEPSTGTGTLLAFGVGGVMLFGWITGRARSAAGSSSIRELIRQTRALEPAKPLERLPEDGADESLQELARAINEVLDRAHEPLQRERNLVDDLAHELRTPLTAQISLAETALAFEPRDAAAAAAGPAADPRVLVHSLLEEARHMERLISGLLTLARLNAARDTVSLQPVDMVGMAQSCVETLRVLAEEKEQSLEVVHHGRPLAEAEPTMLRQCLMNIVHNAIDHCGTGARIRVRVSAGFVRGRHFDPRHAVPVSVSVEDNGPGIAADQQPLIFQRFFRGGPGGCRKRRGLGLGLAIAKAMTEAQGGRIGVESTVRCGTRFLLSFKRASAVHEAIESRPSKPRTIFARRLVVTASGEPGPTLNWCI
jgi:signal transduction histidine kinase